jgi:hypothetical protein
MQGHKYSLQWSNFPRSDYGAYYRNDSCSHTRSLFPCCFLSCDISTDAQRVSGDLAMIDSREQAVKTEIEERDAEIRMACLEIENLREQLHSLQVCRRERVVAGGGGDVARATDSDRH